jgi:hypothetical protein
MVAATAGVMAVLPAVAVVVPMVVAVVPLVPVSVTIPLVTRSRGRPVRVSVVFAIVG